MMHTKNCKRKANGSCLLCKQLAVLFYYHAKHCQKTKCLVPYCSSIKHKLNSSNCNDCSRHNYSDFELLNIKEDTELLTIETQLKLLNIEEDAELLTIETDCEFFFKDETRLDDQK